MNVAAFIVDINLRRLIFFGLVFGPMASLISSFHHTAAITAGTLRQRVALCRSVRHCQYVSCQHYLTTTASQTSINSTPRPRHHHQRDGGHFYYSYSCVHQSGLNDYGHLLSSRRSISSNSDNLESINNEKEDPNIDFDFLRSHKKTRTWKRLRHLIELATRDGNFVDNNLTTHHRKKRRRSIADVGTDHGLLALALAQTEQFDSVLGVDVSKQALADGAYALLEQIQQREKETSRSLTKRCHLDFRYSDGLQHLEPGEADTICIAGMGPNTMAKILMDDRPLSSTSTSICDGIIERHLDRLECQEIVVQPTNSRPRLLMLLYDGLQDSGWVLKDERIEKLSSRFYLTSSFIRSLKPKKSIHDGKKIALPGSILDSNTHHCYRKENEVWNEYMNHHIQWIKKDSAAASGMISDEDRRWLKRFDDEDS